MSSQPAIRILFADDDPILREFAAVHLASEATEVRLAADGLQALTMLAEAPSDMLLLDLEMPGLDGFAVLERIRKDPGLLHLPVMVITGREDVQAIDHAFHLGATAFLTKPINWRLLTYQILYVKRASAAEASLRSGAGETDARGLMRKVARLAEESRLLLSEAEGGGGARLQEAAGRYRSALAAMVSSAA